MTEGRQNLRIRLSFLALWTAILLWLPVEDTSPTNPRILALVASALLTARTYPRVRTRGPIAHAALGLGAGLLVNPLTAGLMILKSGLHAHNIPDFSVAMLARVLADSPVYGLGGLLIGVGIYYWKSI